MASKKIPISFNEQDQANIKELVDLLGLTNVYGDIPKAVKFGIKFTISAMKNPELVYTTLEPSEMQLYFSSIVKYMGRQKVNEKIENLKKNNQIV